MKSVESDGSTPCDVAASDTTPEPNSTKVTIKWWIRRYDQAISRPDFACSKEVLYQKNI